MSPQRIGFIGAGRMTQRRFVNLPAGWTPVAVYDKPGARVEEHVRTDLASLHVPSAREVCALSDLVIVATPHRFLNGYAWLAHDAGCQVFVEKPGGVPGDGQLPPCRVGYNHRFWSGIQEAHKHLSGPVRHIRAAYTHWARPGEERSWRTDLAQTGGGELLDQGSHLIDLCRVFAGDVTVENVVLDRESGHCGEDNAYLALRFATGTAWLHASWHEHRSIFRFELTTDDETVMVEGWPWESQTVEVWRDGRRVFQTAFSVDRSLSEELAGEGATDRDAHAVLRVIEEAYGRSA